MRVSAGEVVDWKMGGCGKGEGFVDGEVGGESGLLLIPDNCWFGRVQGLDTVTLIRLGPFVGARKTRGTSCGRQISDIVLTA